ncbi:hypothetical protein [Alteromonas sp. KUL49]|uniref:hypothetical protein n=1 Tax=Alteromonas sp. KUL49 TaxID=2480798 RepID=UPI00102EFAB4|nr:hypothetical protein [Alteromonas sp. KUL49]TAP38740.1 hypothetical protein EYS00_15165 [Alteromonas sp. KUL49]GEA12695.1 hypothetical protein KUL49_30700 [Alteromonas sp. KUL49]
MAKLMPVAALAVLLTGCMATPEEVAVMANNLKYDPKPSDAHVLALADPFIRMYLKDPDSLKNLVITESFKCYASNMEFSDNVTPKYDYGYWCYKFNYQATNDYGGYVRGYTPAIFVNGELQETGYNGEVIRASDNVFTSF